MKILFLTDNFPPEVNAPATRTYEHCNEWVKKGADVTVITCAPNFPQGKVYDGYKNKLVQKEIRDGIVIIRLWSYITVNNGFLKRILDFLSFSISSLFYLLLKKRSYDIIIATSPQFFTGLTALFVSKIKNIPWIFEVRDLWPEGITVLKRDSKTYRFLEWLESKYYKTASGIVTVTESFKTNIINRYTIPDNNFCVVYNGSNNKLFNKTLINTRLISELGLENKFIIGYAGTLGISHSLDFIVRSLPKIYKQRKDIHFLLIGNGAMEKELKRIIKELNINNITILPPVQKEKIADYISLFDIGVVPLKKNPAYLKVIPSKIFELAAMKKPILLGVDGEAKEIVEKYKAGVFYKPENENDFINKVISMYDNRKTFDDYKTGLTLLSKDFDRQYLADKMYNFIKKIVSESTNY